MNKYLLIIVLILAVIISGYFGYQYYVQKKSAPKIVPTPYPTIQASPSKSQTNLELPIAQFKERITKKPFGIYITPQDSPVQPERFTGYHTGADVEYQDVTADVPVFAVASGTVIASRTVSGYGGVIVMEFSLEGKKHTALYGHIRPSSLPKTGQAVSKGEQIGVLGTGYSAETDGERKHLHFAVLSDNRLDFKGYVQTKSDLSGWIDPLSLYY